MRMQLFSRARAFLPALIVIAGMSCSGGNPAGPVATQEAGDLTLDLQEMAKMENLDDIMLAGGGGSWVGDGLRICKGFFGANVVCTFEDVEWRVPIVLRVLDQEGITDIEVKDTFPAEYSVDRFIATAGQVTVEPAGGGNSATKVTWTIDELPGGSVARLVMLVSTRTNPAGKQEFTSPGVYDLNPGMDAKWTVDGEEVEVEGINQLFVEAIDCD